MPLYNQSVICDYLIPALSSIPPVGREQSHRQEKQTHGVEVTMTICGMVKVLVTVVDGTGPLGEGEVRFVKHVSYSLAAARDCCREMTEARKRMNFAILSVGCLDT